MDRRQKGRQAQVRALTAIYVIACLAISAWQFYDGFTTLHDIVRSRAEAVVEKPTTAVSESSSPASTLSPSPSLSPSPNHTECIHEYSEWTSVVASTTTSNGLDERVCTLCGEVESRVTNPKPTIDTSPGNESVQEMFRLINEARAVAGLNEVYYCDDIQAAADLRAAELNEYYDMQHNRPDGREAVTVFADLGITYTMVGENYTLGPPNAELAMTEFMNSDGHRELILYPNTTGVALAVAHNDEFGLAWVQIFVE